MSQIKVELQEWMGSDRSIAEAAWTSSLTSTGKSKRTEEDVERVVKMLIKDKHATPVESVVLRFWIKMPIAIDRQHVTHRIATHNGMSGRYRTMPSEFLEVPDDVKEIVCKLRISPDIPYAMADFIGSYNKICTWANNVYREQLKELKDKEQQGIITNSEYKRAREFFRGILPQHNMTERLTIMNLRSFANYQKLRNSDYAQPEIKQVAQLMLEQVELKGICPIALNALKENAWQI